MPRFRIFRRSGRQVLSRQDAQSPPIVPLDDEDSEEAWLRRFIDDAASPYLVAAASVRASAGSTSSTGSDVLVNSDTDSNDGDSMTTATGTRHPAVSYANAPFECPICFDAVHQATVPICGHVFCEQCIKTCIRRGSGVCPICRGSLLMLTRVYDIDKVMDAYFVSVQNGGGPIFVTPRPIAFGDSGDLERISVQARNYSLKQRVRIELANIRLTFQLKGWIDGIQLIFKRIFFIIRLNFPKMLVIGIVCGATIGIVLCHVAQPPQICPPHECHLKMTAWEHLVAAIRSLLGLVPVPEPAFEIRYPQVVQPQVFDDVLEYIQAKLNAFGKLLNY